MKKILMSIGISFLFLVGCANKDAGLENKEEAIKLYVENHNKLINSPTIKTDINGTIKSEKTAVSKEELNQSFSGNFLVSTNTNTISGTFKADVKDHPIKYDFAVDNNYIYLTMDKQAIKFKLPTDLPEAKDNKEIDIAEANKLFDNFDNVKYAKVDDDGVNVLGYEISGDVSLKNIMEQTASASEIENQDILKALDEVKLHTIVYVPYKVNGEIHIKLNFKIDSIFAKVSIEDLNIQLSLSKEKVNISPNITKNAIDISGMEGMNFN